MRSEEKERGGPRVLRSIDGMSCMQRGQRSVYYTVEKRERGGKKRRTSERRRIDCARRWKRGRASGRKDRLAERDEKKDSHTYRRIVREKKAENMV